MGWIPRLRGSASPLQTDAFCRLTTTILHGKMRTDNESMLMPILKTLLFTVLVPGTVAVWIPYRLAAPAPPVVVSIRTLLSACLIAIGVALYLATAFRFAVVGLGTPAPIAPTKSLVVSGLHRYVRNPMYIGVLSLVAGEAVLFHSWQVVEYAVCLAGAFHLFVIFYEEPALQRQFGDSYLEYCARTRRWLPRLRPD